VYLPVLCDTTIAMVTRLLVLLPLTLASSRHRQMTLEVVAGYEECFYVDNVKSGQTIELEFQVTDSSAPTGQNDITVKVQTPYPSFQPLYQDFMVKRGEYSGVVEEDGDYRICLDNRASRWSDKTVWFEVQVEDPEDDYDDDYIDADDWESIRGNNEDTESLFSMKVEEIKSSVHMVRLNINKIRHFFFMHAGQMSKDTNQVDANFERINFWSVVHLLLMVIVGVSQVITLKSLFCERSTSKI